MTDTLTTRLDGQHWSISGRIGLAGRAEDPWMGVLPARLCRSLNAERVREGNVPSLENPLPLDAS